MDDPIPNSGAPDRLSARFHRADWLCFGITTLLTLCGYLLTLAPEVTLDYSGTLTTGAMYGGVGFAGGYPVWTIYSWLFIKLLPFSNPAWRVAVGSAIAAAVSCGLVALMVSRGGRIILAGMPAFERLTPREQDWIRGVSGYAAGLALGFSGGLWGEALIADYVTFTVLLFASTLFLLLRWRETNLRLFCWLAFLSFGLLLTNSQEMITGLPGILFAIMLFDRQLGRDVSLVMLPVAVLVTSITQYAVWDCLSLTADWPLLIVFMVAVLVAMALIVRTRNFGSEWKSALACAGFLLLGFATVLYLPIVSATNPPVNWAYPRTLEGFIHSVSRGQFERVRPVNNLNIFATQMWGLVKQTGSEFGWLYLFFAALPFGFLPQLAKPARKWIYAWLLISACIGPLLLALLNPASDRQSQEMIECYFFPLRVLLALWTGLGLMLFATKIIQRFSHLIPRIPR